MKFNNLFLRLQEMLVNQEIKNPKETDVMFYVPGDKEKKFPLSIASIGEDNNQVQIQLQSEFEEDDFGWIDKNTKIETQKVETKEYDKTRRCQFCGSAKVTMIQNTGDIICLDCGHKIKRKEEIRKLYPDECHLRKLFNSKGELFLKVRTEHIDFTGRKRIKNIFFKKIEGSKHLYAEFIYTDYYTFEKEYTGYVYDLSECFRVWLGL